MSFSLVVKKELISKTMNKKEMTNFIIGALFTSFKNESLITITIKNDELLNLFVNLLKKVEFAFKQEKNKILIDSIYIKSINSSNAPIFLAGSFFLSGSISNLNSSSYHLQITFKSQENASNIREFAKKHINFQQINHQNKFVLYLKKNENISDFMNIIGAMDSYFEFIDNIIKRDYRNQITRISNLDIHNQNKMVDSHQLFLLNYEYILKNNLTFKFKEEELIFFKFKKENEFLPLSQICEKLKLEKNIIKTKGGLNHWLIKLRRICEEHQYLIEKNESK